MENKPVRAWHFLRYSKDKGPVLRNGEYAPPVGEWFTHEGEVEICFSGLHASKKALDAISYVTWTNTVACLVECEDVVEEHYDKFVCRRRRIIGMCHADLLLGRFAHKVALSVSNVHRFPPYVYKYLYEGQPIKAAYHVSDVANYAAQEVADNARCESEEDRLKSYYAAFYAAKDKLNQELEELLLKEMNLDKPV